jgi:hypothetical protein
MTRHSPLCVRRPEKESLDGMIRNRAAFVHGAGMNSQYQGQSSGVKRPYGIWAPFLAGNGPVVHPMGSRIAIPSYSEQ